MQSWLRTFWWCKTLPCQGQHYRADLKCLQVWNISSKTLIWWCWLCWECHKFSTALQITRPVDRINNLNDGFKTFSYNITKNPKLPQQSQKPESIWFSNNFRKSDSAVEKTQFQMLAVIILLNNWIQSYWCSIYAFVHSWRLVLQTIHEIKQNKADLRVLEKESSRRKQSECNTVKWSDKAWFWQHRLKYVDENRWTKTERRKNRILWGLVSLLETYVIFLYLN